MQRLANLEEYYACINEAKARCGSLKTNCTLFPDAIQRDIDLGRLYAETVSAGVVFFADEARFYQLYFHVNPDEPFTVSRRDKPVVMQNVYKGEKKNWLLTVEEQLRASGFEWKDTMRHGIFNGYDQIPRLRRSMKPIERIFQKEGLTYAPLRREQIPEMLAFQETIDELPFYQFPYFTDDEYMEEAAAERLCCVTDASGRIVGARHLIVNGKKAYGWVGVEERYKTLYGVAMMFLIHALDYIEKNDVKMCSWVMTTNTPSLEYHERLGTDWTGHVMDEWLLA